MNMSQTLIDSLKIFGNSRQRSDSEMTGFITRAIVHWLLNSDTRLSLRRNAAEDSFDMEFDEFECPADHLSRRPLSVAWQ